MAEHDGMDPDTALPVSDSTSPNTYQRPIEPREVDPDIKMNDPEDLIEGPDLKTYSQEQAHKSPASKRPKFRDTISNIVTSTFISKAISHPYSTTSRHLSSSSQQRNTSNASVAMSRGHGRDICHHEPCPKCSAEYEARINDINDSHKQQLRTITEEQNDREKLIERLRSAKAVRKEEIAKLKAEINTRDAHIDILKPQIDTRDVEIENLKSEIAARRIKMEEFESEIMERDIEIERQSKTTIRERSEKEQRIDHLNSEITAREAQIRALKHTISKTCAGNSDTVPDNKINSEYHYLISQLKNWTRANFRRSKPTKIEQTIINFGLDPNLDAQNIAAINKLLGGNISQSRCLAIDMLVMWYLCKNIFNRFLFGLEEREEDFFKKLEASFKTAPQKEINLWRSTTVQMVTATESHKHKVDCCKEEIVSKLESILTDILPSPISSNMTSWVENLKTIITQAADLSFTLRMQRPLYLMISFQPGEIFEDNILEPAEDNADDSDTDSEAEGRACLSKKRSLRKVGLTIFPSLLKQGNEDGEKCEEEICIHKGKAIKA